MWAGELDQQDVELLAFCGDEAAQAVTDMKVDCLDCGGTGGENHHCPDTNCCEGHREECSTCDGSGQVPMQISDEDLEWSWRLDDRLKDYEDARLAAEVAVAELLLTKWESWEVDEAHRRPNQVTHRTWLGIPMADPRPRSLLDLARKYLVTAPGLRHEVLYKWEASLSDRAFPAWLPVPPTHHRNFKFMGMAHRPLTEALRAILARDLPVRETIERTIIQHVLEGNL